MTFFKRSIMICNMHLRDGSPMSYRILLGNRELLPPHRNTIPALRSLIQLFRNYFNHLVPCILRKAGIKLDNVAFEDVHLLLLVAVVVELHIKGNIPNPLFQSQDALFML
jgi:hypothetical protein